MRIKNNKEKTIKEQKWRRQKLTTDTRALLIFAYNISSNKNELESKYYILYTIIYLINYNESRNKKWNWKYVVVKFNNNDWQRFI